jgi:hypothetical protein
VQEQVPTGAVTPDGKRRAPMWCMLAASRIWGETKPKLDALDIALAEQRRLAKLYGPKRRRSDAGSCGGDRDAARPSKTAARHARPADPSRPGRSSIITFFRIAR